MPIATRAEPILEHERGDAVLVQPKRVIFSFVLRQAAVPSARTNHHRGARRLLRVRQKRCNGRNVLFLAAQCVGRAVGPEWNGILDLSVQLNREAKRKGCCKKSFHGLPGTEPTWIGGCFNPEVWSQIMRPGRV